MSGKVFISWSKERSGAIAGGLRAFLRNVDERIEPFVSRYDISAGLRWHQELDRALKSAEAAVVCLTPAALESQWVMFETGALSASNNCKRLIPYYVDRDAPLTGPLSAFQSGQANASGTWELLIALAESLHLEIPATDLRKKFDEHWTDFQRTISQAPLDANFVSQRHRRNVLDQRGLSGVLHIYFLAAADEISRVFTEELHGLGGERKEPNFPHLTTRIALVIDEFRAEIAPLHADVIGSLVTLFDNNLPESKLETLVREWYAEVGAYKDPILMQKAAYRHIRKAQAKLKRQIETLFAEANSHSRGTSET